MTTASNTAPPPSAKTARIAFAALCGFLVLLPFALILPGTPGGLKADESAYYLMAMSLAFDGDVRLEAEDTERLFDEFSQRPTRNLVVMSNDGWDTMYYGKPHLYSLVAAPFARLAGYRGIVVFNMLLFLGLIWMLARYLRQTESSGSALLFATLFFLLGTTWNFVFWIQPEILSMFGVGGALFFGLRRPLEPAANAPKIKLARLTTLPMAATSGALLAVGVYNKPYLVPLGLIFLFGAIHHGRTVDRGAALRWFGIWSAGVAAAFLVSAGSAWLLTGSPSSYVGIDRDSVTVCEPGEVPLGPAALAAQAAEATEVAATSSTDSTPSSTTPAVNQPVSKSWTWIFRIPPVTFGENVENLVYFFIGRHTGLLLYFPFVGVAILSFLLASVASRRNRTKDPLNVERWTLLLSGLGIGVFLLIFISWNWQGGGGFVGNRYFVPVVPAFGFLVSRVRPIPLTVGALAAGLFLGASLLSPLGLPAPEPTLQAHTRSGPLSAFPLELTLKNVPGYYTERLGGLRLRARKDRWLRDGEGFWIKGRAQTEVIALSDQRLEQTSFLVQGVTANPALVTLDFAGSKGSATVAKGQSTVLNLSPAKHRRRHNPDHQPWNVYPLQFTSDQGASLPWKRHMPRNPCPSFARDTVGQESFFAGARIAILGPTERLSLEVFDLEWNQVHVPPAVETGAMFEVPLEVTNRSSSTWPAWGGSAAVKFSYHWLSADGGETIDFNGRRTELPKEVAPGENVGLALSVQAPPVAGTYVLELDPVFEYVGWFSDRGVATVRRKVQVSAASAGSASSFESPSLETKTDPAVN